MSLKGKTMKEIWKDIPKYEGYYQASNLGRIKSLEKKHGRNYSRLKPECILSPAHDKNGYTYLRLSKKGKSKTFKVHRIILYTFKGESDKDINHKNGIKDDNKLYNLEYCTQKENNIHAYKLGLKKPVYKKIICNETKKIYGGLILAAKEFGIHPSGIWHQLNGDQPTAAGFTFKYINKKESKQ